MAREMKLLQAAMDGNTAAFEQIVKKYQSLVCAITFSGTGRVEISEELAQETFLSAWKNLRQLKELSGFRPWLCTIARNILNNYYRKKKTVSLDPAEMADLSDQTPTPSDNLITQEEHVMLELALMQIPAEYREPLVMFYRQEKSTKEVAIGLGLKESTVRMRLHRARQMLREEIAARLERTLERTAPDKTFTKAVMVGIEAGLAAGAAGTASAAVAITGATGTATSASTGLAAVMSTVTAKIITAAIIVVIVAIATFYSIIVDSDSQGLAITQQPQSPVESIQHASKGNANSATQTLNDSPQKSGLSTETSLVKPTTVSSARQALSPDSPLALRSSIEPKANNPEPVTGITGTVIDKTTSKPISNAEIYMRAPMGKISVKTDSFGKFDISMNLKGNEKVPDQFEHFFNVIAKTYTTRRVSVHIKKNIIADIGTVELTPGTKVAGIVYDQNNEPIKDAEVATFQFTNHPVTTDAEGKFEIDGLDPSWNSYSLQSEHSDYPAATISFSPLKAGETVYSNIIMTKGITVHGRVTDTEGKPIRGVAIGNTTSRSMWNVIEDKTDAEGNYILKNVPPGELVIWAINQRYAPYVENFTLNSDSDKKQIDIQLLEPTPLYGKVIDYMENPVPDVSVCIREYKGVSNLSDHRVKTNTAGLFTIPNAPPEGKLILSVFSKDIPNTHPELEIGQELYTITVDRAGKIYGKVIAKESQTPIKNFTVKMGFSKVSESKSGYAATWSRQGHTFSSNEGCFDTGTENIPIGSGYALTVFADGFEPLMVDPVFVQSASDTPERTEFALNPASLIKGLVVDCNNIGIPEARIRWITGNTDGEHWDDRDTAITNTNGQFSIASIGNNADAIYVSAALFSPVIFTPDNLPYNKKGVLEFKLEKAPCLYGFVTDNDGNPVAGASVRVQPYYDIERNWRFPSPQTTTDINGFYEIFDLPTGLASIMASWPNKRSSNINQKRITFLAGQEIEYNICPPEYSTISGTIPDYINDIENIRITPYLYHPGYLLDCDWHGYSKTVTNIESDGSFTSQNLPEGKYFLFLSTQNAQYQDRQYATTDIFELNAENPIKNLTFNLSTSALETHAVDIHRGNELSDANFHLKHESGYWLFPRKFTSYQDNYSVSDCNNVAIFDFIPAGKYKAIVQKKGYFIAESEYIVLHDNETKSITVEMSPCAIAGFKLTQSVCDELTTDHAYLECRITNNVSGQFIPIQSDPRVEKIVPIQPDRKVKMYEVGFWKDRNGQWNEASLNLPEGGYTINYSLYIIESGKKVQQLKGSNSLDMTTGQTTTIEITSEVP